jgi:hypothetical protein
MTTGAEIALALAGGLVVWFVARSELRSPLAAALPAIAVAGALYWLPGAAHGAINEARAYHRIGRYKADNAGAIAVGLDPHTFDRIRAIVPAHDTLYVQGSGKFRFWAYTDLLPRLAVGSPHDAEWVLVHRPPLAIPGIRFAHVYHLHGATLGKVAP